MGLIYIIITFLFFFILYIVIQSAINNSELTETLKQLNRKLEKSRLIQEESRKEEDEYLLTVKYDNCPGCNKKILLNEEKCPKCGLLIAKESCPACGTQVFLNNKECNSCGLKLRDS
ncbi:double zinc ribbon domain-containing protein [Chengkuizengella sediminis]|uniref:double zinc ribbon domain-containing protein n=1 Tax=Chengkuizengella sediminis TaxID=1885917 RepID=UPI001389CB65|nr:hypothetical protein [Chengkuizengella sediminis]NDI35211.1 hypothetical protein [Chengkuizengella sediminis]